MSAFCAWLADAVLQVALAAATLAVAWAVLVFTGFALLFLVHATRVLWEDYIGPRLRRTSARG